MDPTFHPSVFLGQGFDLGHQLGDLGILLCHLLAQLISLGFRFIALLWDPENGEFDLMLDFLDIFRERLRTYLIKSLIILLAGLVKVSLDLREISLVLLLLLLILQDVLDGEVLGILKFLFLHL